MKASILSTLKFLKVRTAIVLSVCAMFSTVLVTSQAHAEMITTQSAQQAHIASVTRAELLDSLSSAELQASLESMGVDPVMAQERVANLTDAEIAELNQTLAEQPAGAGIAGAIVTVFIVLVITDMLCATNVFRFVNCINR